MSSPFPLPDLTSEKVAPYYAGAERGELVIPRCASCGRFNWYPPEVCAYCGAADLPWTAVSGAGELFSWAVVGRAFARQFSEKVPYVAALVSLAEAPEVRIVSNVVDCDPHQLKIGMPLQAVFRTVGFADVEGSMTAPFFVPQETS
jgi:uncharacterized OB-fold protein